MEAPTVDVLSLFDTNELLSEADFAELVKTARCGDRQREQFTDALNDVISTRQSELADDAGYSLKVGQSFYALCQYDPALEWLEKAGDGEKQCYLKSRCLKGLGQHDKAVEQLELAESKGMGSFETAMAIVDCLRLAGDLDSAHERLKRVSRVGDIRAEYHFQLARLHDVGGDHEEALDEYYKAIELDENHTAALFHLAYACDLYGDEDEAVEFYERCVMSGPVHINALMNLAVIYEEFGDYDEAERCITNVLNAYPNHSRARMFQKDVLASRTMFIDEDHARMVDKRNQVLEIPISDFELSVRSRNCLKKMNIRTIEDLLNVTEVDLLAYKNFGETSLSEVKVILAQKGLRLGQMLEERPGGLDDESDDLDDIIDNPEELGKPIGDLQLSIRARKCLQRLNINTIGDLAKRTEAELLGCKNFGMTSLFEIKQRLKDKNINLRQLEGEELQKIDNLEEDQGLKEINDSEEGQELQEIDDLEEGKELKGIDDLEEDKEPKGIDDLEESQELQGEEELQEGEG